MSEFENENSIGDGENEVLSGDTAPSAPGEITELSKMEANASLLFISFSDPGPAMIRLAGQAHKDLITLGAALDHAVWKRTESLGKALEGGEKIPVYRTANASYEDLIDLIEGAKGKKLSKLVISRVVEDEAGREYQIELESEEPIERPKIWLYGVHEKREGWWMPGWVVPEEHEPPDIISQGYRHARSRHASADSMRSFAPRRRWQGDALHKLLPPWEETIFSVAGIWVSGTRFVLVVHECQGEAANGLGALSKIAQDKFPGSIPGYPFELMRMGK